MEDSSTVSMPESVSKTADKVAGKLGLKSSIAAIFITITVLYLLWLAHKDDLPSMSGFSDYIPAPVRGVVNPNSDTVTALSAARLPAPWTALGIDGMDGGPGNGYMADRTTAGAANISSDMLNKLVASGIVPPNFMH